jgi:hypothetical protein
MQKWKYFFSTYQGKGWLHDEMKKMQEWEGLKYLGDLGWELVSVTGGVTSLSTSTTYYFKKPAD